MVSYPTPNKIFFLFPEIELHFHPIALFLCPVLKYWIRHVNYEYTLHLQNLKLADFCLSFKYTHRTGREVVMVFGRLLYWNVR